MSYVPTSCCTVALEKWEKKEKGSMYLREKNHRDTGKFKDMNNYEKESPQVRLFQMWGYTQPDVAYYLHYKITGASP